MKLKLIFFYLICRMPLLEAHGHCHHYCEEHEEEFQWTKEKSECAQIQTQTAGPGTLQNYIQVSGKVSLHPDHRAYVTSKVCGTVWDIRKNLGDLVRKGEIVALVESSEIAEAKTDYLIAQNKSLLYEALLQKEEIARCISPEQDYLNAKSMAEEAVILLHFATQNLYALGMNDQEILRISQENPQTLRFYAIKSPLKGRILERNLSLGELSEEGAKIFTVANFDKVWIEMHVPQSDVHYLKEGLPVEIEGCNNKTAYAQVCQFNPAIDEQTRMATAIASLENHSDQWKPGEFVTVLVQTDTLQAPIVIPQSALQNIKGQTVVFVEEESGFNPRPVRLGKMDRQNVEVLSGLNEGEIFAACNTFCMKAEYQKEEAEHSH